MFPIQCDHLRGWRWPFVWRCKAVATKHLLHYPWNGYGPDPQVMLLCADHYQDHFDKCVELVEATGRCEVPLKLSAVIRDMGDI